MDIALEALNRDRPIDGASGLPFAHLVDRISGKGARAWDVHYHATELQREGRDAIFLSVGDPDFPTPAAITEACHRSILAGNTHYVPAAGIKPLREAIARQESKTLGRSVSAAEVIVTAGAQSALFSTMQCLAGLGDEVILFDPAYATFEGLVRATGADVVHVSLAIERDFGLDLARLEAAITERTRAILLNFPHNPTGRILSEQQVDDLARLLKPHKIWVVADEVYGNLCYDGAYNPLARHPDLADRTVSIRSLSKSHAMSGWRLGWATAPLELAEHMQTLTNCIQYGLPQFIQDAATFALENDLPEVAEMREAYRERRDFVVDRISRIPRLSCIRPDSGIFCMIDVTATGLNDQEFCWQLVEAEAVSLLPAGAFGPSGEGYARLSYTLPIARLSEALDRLERFVVSL